LNNNTMKFSSNTTNALFSLLVFGNLAPTLAFWDHKLEDWFSPGDSNWWDAAPWMTPDGELPDGFLNWDNYGEERETAITESTIRFLGGNCAQSVYKMSQNVFSCEDFGSATIGTGTYFIEAAGGSGSKSYFTGDVAVGSEYTLKGPFDDPTVILTIKVYTAQGGDLLQTVTFNYNNANFENPHLMGDKYGASQLIGWVDSTGKTSTIDPKNVLTIAPTNVPNVASTNAPTNAPTNVPNVEATNAPTLPPTQDESGLLRPTNAPTLASATTELTNRFLGGNCVQSDTSLSRDVFSCEDFGIIGLSGTYHIEAAGGTGSKSYFTGDVAVGSEYTLKGPFDDPTAITTIKVYTVRNGDLLQTVTFNFNNAGFENPLFIGDVWGASQVIKWVDSTISPIAGDNGCIDPTRTITYRLNGGTCAQSDTTMSRSLFTCEDASSGQTVGTAGIYYIEATGSENNVYFSGSVPVGSEYTLNANRAFDSLGSTTITVYTSQGGDVLQTVTLNDMTCTNPLFLFDKFGASQVTEWVETSGRVVTSGMSKENVESVVDDAEISTTGGVAALDTGSSTATTNTVTIAAAFVVVVASAITLI